MVDRAENNHVVNGKTDSAEAPIIVAFCVFFLSLSSFSAAFFISHPFSCPTTYHLSWDSGGLDGGLQEHVADSIR